MVFRMWPALSIVLFSGQLAFAGSVSGGGGGTAGGDPVSEKEIVRAVAESRIVVDSLLRSGEFYFPEVSGPLERLLRPGADIFNFLGTVTIKIGKTCHDLDGTQTDASANTDVPQGICISPARIAPKVNELTYEAEVAALIIHELSHLFGAPEPEAVSAQKFSLRKIRNNSPADLQHRITKVLYDFSKIAVGLDTYREKLELGERFICGRLWENVTDLSIVTSALHAGTSDEDLYLVRKLDSENFYQEAFSLMNMADFLCTLPDFRPGDPAESIERYNAIWANDTVLPANAYFERSYQTEIGAAQVPVYVRKFENPLQVRDDLFNLHRDLQPRFTEGLEKLLRNKFKIGDL